MRLIAIATIQNKKQINGFRLLDIDNKEIKDITYESVAQALSTGKATIDNLTIRGAKIICTNGSMDRLPKIVNGTVNERLPIIILGQIGESGYLVSDYKGQIAKLLNKDAIYYAATIGISNGKLVEKNGKTFLSSISGKYPLINDEGFINIDNKIKEYKAKCKLLGVQQLDIIQHNSIAIVKDAQTNIKKCVIPNFVSKIADHAFLHCSLIEELVIPPSVKHIGKNAFKSCTNLKSIELPDEMEQIETEAFAECGELKCIRIPRGIKSIERGLFRVCLKLENVELSDTVEIISDSAFDGCTNLKYINLPNGLTELKHKAFNNCKSLKKITIPRSVTSIGLYAFDKCSPITLRVPKKLEDMANALVGVNVQIYYNNPIQQ